MLSQLKQSANELIENCFLKEIGFQLYWPCQHNAEVKIPGPKIILIEGNYWVAEGQIDKKYTQLEELVTDLAYMEEARRIRAVQDEFDDRLKSGFFNIGTE